MTPNRTLLAALGLATAAALTLTACSAKSSTTSASGPTTAPATQSPPTPPPSASDKLATAIRLLRVDGFDFTLNVGYPGGQAVLGGPGSYDPHANAATIDLKGKSFGTEYDFAATEILGKTTANHMLWVKVNNGSANTQYSMPRKKWMAFDSGKVSGTTSLPFDLSGQDDILDISDLLASVSNVQTGSDGVTGMVDLTKAAGLIAPTSAIQNATTQASAVPFAAVLDSQGRLTSLVIDTRSFSKEAYRAVTIRNYGSPHAIKPPPASSVVPATAKNYDYLNS